MRVGSLFGDVRCVIAARLFRLQIFFSLGCFGDIRRGAFFACCVLLHRFGRTGIGGGLGAFAVVGLRFCRACSGRFGGRHSVCGRTFGNGRLTDTLLVFRLARGPGHRLLFGVNGRLFFLIFSCFAARPIVDLPYVRQGR